ncbi:MAG: uridine phosphorylase, partial [Deinococcus sp.]|nr:uridine phosphorylase [Deinococcus sp.]
ALLQAAAELKAPHHLGLTATASGFYGFQGRNVPGFPPRDPELWKHLAQVGVLNLEMESSTLFTLASLRGVRAGTVCAVYAQRPRNEFIAEGDIPAAEARAINVGLRALEVLHAIDQAKGQAPYWYPALGLK